MMAHGTREPSIHQLPNKGQEEKLSGNDDRVYLGVAPAILHVSYPRPEGIHRPGTAASFSEAPETLFCWETLKYGRR